jgi:hypothetical protein
MARKVTFITREKRSTASSLVITAACISKILTIFKTITDKAMVMSPTVS